MAACSFWPERIQVKGVLWPAAPAAFQPWCRARSKRKAHAGSRWINVGKPEVSTSELDTMNYDLERTQKGRGPGVPVRSKNAGEDERQELRHQGGKGGGEA